MLKTLRSKLGRIILCAVIMSLFASCGGRSSHCCLCQGIPYDAPCLVDLSTGGVIPLTVSDNNGAVSFQVLGRARVELEPGAAHAIIPAEPRVRNADLFCNECLALIDATPNNGYVLADLSSPDNVSIYPIDPGATITILNYDISAEADSDDIQIQVAAPMEE